MFEEWVLAVRIEMLQRASNQHTGVGVNRTHLCFENGEAKGRIHGAIGPRSIVMPPPKVPLGKNPKPSSCF